MPETQVEPGNLLIDDPVPANLASPIKQNIRNNKLNAYCNYPTEGGQKNDMPVPPPFPPNQFSNIFQPPYFVQDGGYFGYPQAVPNIYSHQLPPAGSAQYVPSLPPNYLQFPPVYPYSALSVPSNPYYQNLYVNPQQTVQFPPGLKPVHPFHTAAVNQNANYTSPQQDGKDKFQDGKLNESREVIQKFLNASPTQQAAYMSRYYAESGRHNACQPNPDSVKFDLRNFLAIGSLTMQEKIVYSHKVFIGGVPISYKDDTEKIRRIFSQFGPIDTIVWPDIKKIRDGSEKKNPGYCYVIFEETAEDAVRNLLKACKEETKDDCNFKFNEYKFPLAENPNTQPGITKKVEIIPWIKDNSKFEAEKYRKMDTNTMIPVHVVFIGALHGLISAKILAELFEKQFGSVAYTQIDTDKHEYPIGSGRVAFWEKDAMVKALEKKSVDVECAKFRKKLQIDPFLLDDIKCKFCVQIGGRKQLDAPFCCRKCLQYRCQNCFDEHIKDLRRRAKNSQEEALLLDLHRPITKKTRKATAIPPNKEALDYITNTSVNYGDNEFNRNLPLWGSSGGLFLPVSGSNGGVTYSPPQAQETCELGAPQANESICSVITDENMKQAAALSLYSPEQVCQQVIGIVDNQDSNTQLAKYAVFQQPRQQMSVGMYQPYGVIQNLEPQFGI